MGRASLTLGLGSAAKARSRAVLGALIADKKICFLSTFDQLCLARGLFHIAKNMGFKEIEKIRYSICRSFKR